MTSRDSCIFHAFFDTPTASRYRLRGELSSGRSTVQVTFKRRRYDAEEERYKWCEPLTFTLPADQATTQEALVVAREKETGLQRPSQLRKRFYVADVGKEPLFKA